MCALKLFTGIYFLYSCLAAGDNYSDLEGLQGGHGNQSGWKLVPDVDGGGDE